MVVCGAGSEGARQEAGYVDMYVGGNEDIGGEEDERRKRSEERDRGMNQS